MDFLELMKYLPDYSTWTQGDYIYHALWGLVGGLVRITYSNATVAMPARTEDGWKLNALGEFFVSSVFGLLANTNPAVTVMVAIVAPTTLETVVQSVRTRINKKLE